MSLRQTVPPVLSPVTVDEVKTHLRVEGTDQDEDIHRQLLAATKLIEDANWIQLITATWELKMDEFPEVIFAPRGPLQSATIQYVDGAGATQTLSPSAYTVDASSQPGRIVPAYGYCWPVTRTQLSAVTVTMVNGFGDSPDDIPATIKQAILVLTAVLYESRGACGAGMPEVIDHLMSPYRMTYTLSLIHI